MLVMNENIKFGCVFEKCFVNNWVGFDDVDNRLCIKYKMGLCFNKVAELNF